MQPVARMSLPQSNASSAGLSVCSLAGKHQLSDLQIERANIRICATRHYVGSFPQMD